MSGRSFLRFGGALCLAAGVLAMAGVSGQAQAANGVIAGQIRRPDGTPLAGMRVAVMEAVDGRGRDISLLGLVESGSDGRYRVENLPPGRYYIVAGPLEVATYFPGVSDRSRATPVQLSNGQFAANLDFVVAASSTGFRVSGRLVRKGLVERVFIEGGLIRPTAVVAADGSFQFDHVLPGRYTLNVSPAPPNFRHAPLAIDDRDVRIEVEVPVTIKLTVRVSVRDNGPTPPFVLSLVGVALSRPLALPLTPQSRDEFSVIASEGEYRLSISRFPSSYVLESLRYGTSDVLETPLAIREKDPQEISIRFGPKSGPWGKISGKVAGMENLGPKGSPVAVLQAYDHSFARIGTQFPPIEAPIAPDGSFEFPATAPGLATVSVDTAGFGPATTLVNGKFGVAQDVELSIPARREVAGRLILDGGGPPSSFALVTRQSPLTFRVPVNVQPDGRFSVVVPNGEKLAIVELDEAFYLRAFTYGALDLFHDAFDAETSTGAPIQINLARVDMAPRFKVSGRLTGAVTECGGVVGLIGVMPDRPVIVQTNDAGGFFFPPVLPGPYTLIAYEESPRRLGPTIDYSASPTLAIVVADKDIRDVEIRMPRPDIMGALCSK